MASSLFMFVDPDQYIVTGLIAIDVFAAIGYLDKNFARISSTENPPPSIPQRLPETLATTSRSLKHHSLLLPSGTVS